MSSNIPANPTYGVISGSSGWNPHHARLVEDQGGGAHPVCPIIIASFNNLFILNAVEILFQTSLLVLSSAKSFSLHCKAFAS